MKTLLFTIICLIASQTLSAQSRVRGDVIYLYCSAATQDTPEGIERYEDTENDNDPFFAHRPISFEMKSKIKNIYLLFFHCSFNLTELSKIRPVDPAKDQMEIVTGPRTMLRFINTFNPITLEDKLASFKTKEESWAWVDSLKATGQDIYLIDWRDPINGGGGTELRLVQVVPKAINRPLY